MEFIEQAEIKPSNNPLLSRTYQVQTWLFLGCGVSANFHVRRNCGDLTPATSLMGTASEISFKSSFVSLTCNDPILSYRFLILVVPRDI